MNALLSFLSGKKTYLTLLAIGVLLFGSWQGWWKIPVEFYGGLAALALAFLRSSIATAASAGADDGGPQPVPIKTPTLPRTGAETAALTAALILGILLGCAQLQPGADPLVVNTERTETIAKTTFDLVMQVDNTDRGFWRTNAPAFHSFVEWLREPQTVQTNTLPRCLAMILSVDDVKLDYRAARASSNDLATAVLTLHGALNQAGAWLTVVTNKPIL